METDKDNPEFWRVVDLIENTDTNVFLSGEAGTGKSYLVNYITEHSKKVMAKAAPTGLAAINIGGETLHSLFSLPIHVISPDDHNFRAQRYFKLGFRKEFLQKMELLIIDEISMVRADILDAVDISLRIIRHSTKPFGGVQVLMVGDLLQLPPVLRKQEQKHLSAHYSNYFFFNAKVMLECSLEKVCLTKIYRQSDQQFISMLNEIRRGELSPKSAMILDSLVDPFASNQVRPGYVYLATHNWMVDQMNAAELAKLPGVPNCYEGKIRDKFNEGSFPAPEHLELKPGAQVMYLRNNPDAGLYNGKIGVVVRCNEESVAVDFDGGEYLVQRFEWENRKYVQTKYGPKSQVIGSYTQIPLKLAWSVSVHKSQGQTFDKVIASISEAFDYGQVYVALSRCRTLEGLVLDAPVPSKGVKAHPDCLEFMLAS